MSEDSTLFFKRRFGPLFLTQFFGAFNDNFIKNALVILIAFRTVRSVSSHNDLLIALCPGLLILPFFLFSATAGQLADKYEKARMIQIIKLVEILIMIVAAIGFLTHHIPLLLFIVFCMGTHSTFFGPLKYSILPQHLQEKELVEGNGFIEMGTFLAILIGTVLGGLLIPLEPWGPWIVAAGVVIIAILGLISSLWIPPAPSQAGDLKINWNIFSSTFELHAFAKKDRAIYLSILGISWFWFFGGTFLILFPKYSRDFLHCNEQVVTLFLTVFSVGIGIGSLLCKKLSGDKVEIGLVPFGSIGLTLFTAGLCFSGNLLTHHLKALPPNHLMGLMEFLKIPGSWPIIFALMMIAMFGGFFIVPLYAFIQERSDPASCSRVIAANNILNAFFMVLSSLMMIIFFKLKVPIPYVFAILVILNLLVSGYIYHLIPEFLIRFIVWLLVHSIYKLEVKGLEHIPEKGPAVLVCNHITFVDGLIIAAASKRLVRFVMDHAYTKTPIVGYVFEKGRGIPIAPRKENPEILEKAYAQISTELKQGEILCIFPEGGLTKNGEMGDFKPGIERILARDPVPVIPMALQGLWGSFFSRLGGKAMARFPRRIGFRIALNIGPAVNPAEASAPQLRQKVAALRGDWK